MRCTRRYLPSCLLVAEGFAVQVSPVIFGVRPQSERFSSDIMPRSKATYAQVYDYVWEHSHIKVGGNEIAEAKEKAGLALGKAHNRLAPERRSTHSPQKSIDAIHAAFKHFGMM